MYEGRNFIGFAGANGTKWCKKNREGKNIEVALVRNNDDIIWYLPEKLQPKLLVEKIFKNSQAEKRKFRFGKQD